MRPRIGRGFLQIELTEELYMRSCTAKKLSVILSRCWIEFERAKLLPESVQLVHLVLVHKHRFGEHLYQGNLALGWGGRGGREGESNVGPDLAVETLLLQRPTQRFESTPRPPLSTGVKLRISETLGVAGGWSSKALRQLDRVVICSGPVTNQISSGNVSDSVRANSP
jgi:hypothetical protein